MIPDEEALAQLHKHLNDWQQGADSTLDSLQFPDTSGGDPAPEDLAASLKRGRASMNGQPVESGLMLARNGDKPQPSMGDVAEGPDAAAKPPPDAPIAPSRSPRSTMLSAVMGAKATTPTPPPAATPAVVDQQMADAREKDDAAGNVNRIGRAVTAMGELPDNQGRAIQGLSRGGVTMQQPAHFGLYDHKDGEDNAANLTAQRQANATADRKDPNGQTAQVYRAALLKFSPDLKLDNATPEQMEKIAPWLESYAKDAAAKKAASKPDELPSLKANLKAAYPDKAAEIDSLGSAKAAEDFRLINEGRLGREQSAANTAKQAEATVSAGRVSSAISANREHDFKEADKAEAEKKKRLQMNIEGWDLPEGAPTLDPTETNKIKAQKTDVDMSLRLIEEQKQLIQKYGRELLIPTSKEAAIAKKRANGIAGQLADLASKATLDANRMPNHAVLDNLNNNIVGNAANLNLTDLALGAEGQLATLQDYEKTLRFKQDELRKIYMGGGNAAPPKEAGAKGGTVRMKSKDGALHDIPAAMVHQAETDPDEPLTRVSGG